MAKKRPRGDMRHLAEAWITTTTRLHARDDVAGTGAGLLVQWSQPHRRYHDLRHLDEVLRHVDDLAVHATDPDAVRLAAWYHDAVYDPTADDNEERSADLARAELSALRIDEHVVDEVVRLVLLTASHEVADSDSDGAVLCDADLAVLAADPGRYAEYAAGVRTEYDHVDAAAYATGRAQIMRRLLDRPFVYATSTARRDWEQTARRNVEAELRFLDTP
jgi:predicted metal-dependent HD superfamily phosphohydrolase